MGAETKIEWTATPLPDGTLVPGHTFNPWIGCVKVSQGCKFCYADAQDRRFTGADAESHWGPNAPRRVTKDGNWLLPVAWNRKAEADGVRRRVFCASMADVFEALAPEHPSASAVHAARWRLWRLIEATPWLDWLLLTKRPENVRDFVPERWLAGWPANAWIGTSVEDQATADVRLPQLQGIPAAVLFVSYEPALGPVDWVPYLGDAHIRFEGDDFVPQAVPHKPVSWIIVGGESGPGARPFNTCWAHDTIRQCTNLGVPVFVKQLGAAPHFRERPLHLKDKKGGDMAEWDQDLRVRQFPGTTDGGDPA